MKIQHNMLSMFASNRLSVNAKEKEKNMERLSSGYRINRAGDNASGLAISEKMRGQIRGLNRAAENIEDGISLIHVADSALQESENMVHRMRELCVQAANDTNTEDDRTQLQQEVEQLIQEVDRIAKTTEFNGKLRPLRGSEGANGKNRKSNLEFLDSAVGVYHTPNDLYAVDINTIEKFKKGQIDENGLAHLKDTMATLSDLEVDENGFYRVNLSAKTGDDSFYWYFTANTIEQVKASDVSAAYCQNEGFIKSPAPLAVTEEDFVFVNDLSDDGIMYDIYVNGILADKTNGSSIGKVLTYNGQDIIYSQLVYHAQHMLDPNNGIRIQAGANSGQEIKIQFVDATAQALGIASGAVDVSTHDGASSGITVCDDAIGIINDYRSMFGATQNRLEHALAVDWNDAENLQASESLIRDTDVADVIVHFSKYNILEQVGLSMLAQANQSTQGIAILLQ